MAKLILIHVLAFSTAAFARPGPLEYLQGPWPEAETSSALPPLFPDGGPQNIWSGECLPETVRDYLAGSQTYAAFKERLTGRFRKCEWPWNQDQEQGTLALLRTRQYVSHPETDPHLRRIRLHLPEGTVRHGYARIYKTSKRRPLVVYVCGVFCDVRSKMFRNSALFFADSLDFHLVALTNVTSATDIAFNQVVHLGGAVEGHQILETVRIILQTPELQGKVSGVHLVGESLGGHSAIYSGLYAGILENKNITSVTALCPAVDLDQSMRHALVDNTWAQMIYGPVAKKELGVAAVHVPAIADKLAKYDRPLVRDGLFQVLLEIATESSPRWWWLASRFLDPTLTPDREGFANANNFIRWAPRLRVPTLLVSAENDFLVNHAHPEDLMKSAWAFDIEPLILLRAKYGSHCAFHQAYGWQNMTTLLRSFIEKTEQFASKSRKPETTITYLNPAQKDWWRRQTALWEGEQYIDARFRAQAQASEVAVELRIKRQFDCGDTWTSPLRESCLRKVTIRIPRSWLPQGTPDTPPTSADADRWTRWANNHLQLQGVNNQPFFRSSEPPAGISLRGAGY